MDPGAGPLDTDEIIQRYARRLYVLAYHLTGDGAEADDLTMDVMTRSVLAPDFPATERQVEEFLNRLLIGMWRERLPSGSKGTGPGSAPPSLTHDALRRALSRLDPVSRAVLILRLAEGLEYETIGRVLDMAADVVYARLLQARAGLEEGSRKLSPFVFETMNRYLDARLPNDQRSDFERRIQTDAALREQVEFHRGLTLELHEETPPLPRDFLSRLQGRIERGRETLALVDEAAVSAGWDAAPVAPVSRPRRWPFAVLASAAAAVIVALSIALVVVARRPPPLPASAPPGAAPEGAGGPSPTPDQATIEALRSLGYLAPGKERTIKTPPARPPAKSPRPPKAGAAPAVVKPAPLPSAAPATPTPEPPQASTTAATGPEGAALPWRVLALARAPQAGLDHQVIRTRAEWEGLFEGTGAPAPAIDFDREMAIVLTYGPSGDPPSLQIVTSVEPSADALVIECRLEPAVPGSATAGGVPAGQAVVLPITDRIIRIAVRRE